MRLEGVMTDYSTLLHDHVTLTCRSFDRIFLQAYIPKLQAVGQVCTFLRWQRGFRIPSSAAFGEIGEAYVQAVHDPTVHHARRSICPGNPLRRSAHHGGPLEPGRLRPPPPRLHQPTTRRPGLDVAPRTLYATPGDL